MSSVMTSYVHFCHTSSSSSWSFDKCEVIHPHLLASTCSAWPSKVCALASTALRIAMETCFVGHLFLLFVTLVPLMIWGIFFVSVCLLTMLFTMLFTMLSVVAASLTFIMFVLRLRTRLPALAGGGTLVTWLATTSAGTSTALGTGLMAGVTDPRTLQKVFL